MVYGLYVVRDMVGETFSEVWQSENDGTARRNVRRLLSRIPVEDHECFRLFKIGVYDQSTGIVEGLKLVEEISIKVPKLSEDPE